MNEFHKDAVFFLKRASGHILPGMGREPLIDSVLNFALGMERLFKGILFDINPLFVVESPDLESAVPILYLDKLTPKWRAKIEDELRRGKRQDKNLHAYKASLLMAAKFSPLIETNTGHLLQLGHYRNVLAHRTAAELPRTETWRFVRKTFFPVVTGMAAELQLDPLDFFLCEDRMRALEVAAAEIAAEDDLEKRIDARMAEAAKRWEKLDTPTRRAMACQQTLEELAKVKKWRPKYLVPCPVCTQDSILSAEVESEYEDGQYNVTDVIPDGLTCFYCGMRADGYEEAFYLDLGNLMDEARRWKG